MLDPDRHVRDAIACYPRDAIVDAIGIFAGKRSAGTLPDGVDARYLLGIVKNIHHVHQAESITEALIRERLAARDRFLAPLVRERDAILAGDRDVDTTLLALVDRLVHAERAVDQCVWLEAAATLVEPCEHDHRIALARRAARRVHAAFSLAARDRDRLERARSCAASGRSTETATYPARESARRQVSWPCACLTPHTWHLAPLVAPTCPPFLPGR